MKVQMVMSSAINISSDLLKAILADYRLPLTGLHGPAHWARVLENGRRLAPITGARPVVVELFAVLHDARRINEGIDHEHGRRAAEWAQSLRGSLLRLSADDWEFLCYACRHHTDGLCEANATVQTCWDADRLDLYRAGILPKPQYLCTNAARDPEILDWANARSVDPATPALLADEWGIG